MKTKKENHLNIKNNDFFYTQYSSHLSNSVLDSKSNLILNKINSNNSNLINQKSLITSNNKLILSNSFNSKENDLNSPNLKKKDRNSISIKTKDFLNTFNNKNLKEKNCSIKIERNENDEDEERIEKNNIFNNNNNIKNENDDLDFSLFK